MLRLSSGLQNALLKSTTKAVYSMTSGTVSIDAGAGVNGSDRITDATNFATFPNTLVVGDCITVMGATKKAGLIVGHGANYIDIEGAELVTAVAGASVSIVGTAGGSWAGAFRNGCIRIYSGPQPTTANDGETGTLLCEVSLNSLPHSTGVTGTNGLNFGPAVAGVLGKNPGEVWSGVNLATGAAGWFRFYDNNKTVGVSQTAVRFDGSCSTSVTQLKLSNTNLVTGVTTTVDGGQISIPA